MKRIRGGTGQKRGGVYGGKASTRPASDLPEKQNTRRTSSSKGAVSLAALFPKLTKQVFENYGFSTAQLIADWPAIVGPELAESTIPEKLKWPKGTPEYLDADEQAGGFKNQSRGATLVLRVDGPRSLEVQFGASQIMERINGYFGYKAVTEIRIIQAPVPKKNKKKINIENVDPEDMVKDLHNITNPGLRDALYRMAQGIKASAHKKN